MAFKKTPKAGDIVEKNTDKWGNIDGGLFDGQMLVDLYIPEDDINPAKERFLAINGNQIWLGVGVDLVVPKCVADLWNDSYKDTMKAKRSMKQEIEIKA